MLSFASNADFFDFSPFQCSYYGLLPHGLQDIVSKPFAQVLQSFINRIAVKPEVVHWRLAISILIFVKAITNTRTTIAATYLTVVAKRTVRV